MGVLGKLMSRFNALDPKRDSFAGSVTETSEQTRLGAFLAVVVLPTCVAAYSALYFIQFYYGFGGGSPALYSVTQSETLQYGTQVKELAIECTNPNGCYFRLPTGGATMCQSGVNDQETPTNDFCDTSTNIGPARRRALLENDAVYARHLLTSHDVALGGGPDPAQCGGKTACGVLMDGADGVCAYVAPGSDPTDALTVAWKDDAMTSANPAVECVGHCNFGVSLVTDYLDEQSGTIKQKKIRAHRGITLLSLVERHDSRMEWDAAHPAFATKSGKKIIYEWGITAVDIVGVVQTSNLCRADLATEYGTTGENVNAKGIKFNPFPLYTKTTTTYPSPIMAYLAAVGGIAATVGGALGMVHTVHLEMLNARGSGMRKEEEEGA